MKKLITIAITLIMSFSLIACGGGNSANEGSGESTIEKTKEDTSVTVKIYSYDMEKEDLLENKVKIDKLDGDNVFSALKEKIPVLKDADLNSFEIKKVDGVNTGFIDVDSDFEKACDDPYEECFLVYSLFLTYLYNFDIEQISFSVNGEAYSTDALYISPDDYIDEDWDVNDYIIEEEEEEEEPEEDTQYLDPSIGDPPEDPSLYEGYECDDGYCDDYYDDDYYLDEEGYEIQDADW